MTKILTLGNGQRIKICSISEAIDLLDCSFEELGQWIADGLVDAVQCPNCKLSSPTAGDIEDLVRFIEEYPVSVPLSDILLERANEFAQQAQRKQMSKELTQKALPPKKTLPPMKQERSRLFGNQTLARRDRR